MTRRRTHPLGAAAALFAVGLGWLACSVDSGSDSPVLGDAGALATPATGATAGSSPAPVGGSGGTGGVAAAGTGAAPSGGSASGSCPTGLVLCGDVCVDLGTNALHCGACDLGCSPGQVCSGWQCAEGCALGETACGTSCVDPTTHIEHCGGCDRPCAIGQVCTSGSCVCSGGRTWCDPECVDTDADARHCGGCGQPCPPGRVCTGGSCGCAPEEDECGAECVDTRTDEQHCGRCDNPCGPGLFCNMGECQSQDCAAGEKDCGGTCTDILTSMANCGDCGDVCLGDCCAGTCTQTSSDPNHCGGCGLRCHSPGVCQLYSCECPIGHAYCDDGCINIQADALSCGGCDHTCAAGTYCDWGACVCPDASLSYCDGACRPMDECVVSAFGEGTDTAVGVVWPGGDVCPGTETYASKATYYELGGSLPHCSFPPAGLPQYTAAINEEDYAESGACGACARVFHPASGRELDVMIVDECPYAGNPQWCYPGSHHIDLNPAAFEYFADRTVGVLDVQWQYVDCVPTGNLEYAFKDGSSTYWTAIIFRGHPLPIASVDYQNASGVWRPLTRVDYNYWLDSQGFGIGPYVVRVTDSAGNVLQDQVPALSGMVHTVQFTELGVQLPGCE